MKTKKTIDELVEKDINTTYTNEYDRSPFKRNEPGERGINVYNMSQLMKLQGRDKEGRLLSWGYEPPRFYLTIQQRIQMFKFCDCILGVVTSRMNRISAIDFNIVPKKKHEEQMADELKEYKQMYDEYKKSIEINHIVLKTKIMNAIKITLPDVLPDLSNFDKSLHRWKNRIKRGNNENAEMIKAWLLEPNEGITWETYIKKLIFDLMIHGCEATYKQVENGLLANFGLLPGGTVQRLKNPYFHGLDGYLQCVPGYETQIYFGNEMSYTEYIPTSYQGYGMIPLEALINKISESLLFDNLMANQADGTKPPEKLVIITNPKNPFGSMDKEGDEPLPLPMEEQTRIETKLNEPKKYPIISFSGNAAQVIDLTKENTMNIQMQRQKDIRESVALVFNMSNMEVNLTGSADTSGRSTSEAQSEIEHGKGIYPILKLIENKINKNILPFRFGTSYVFEYVKEKDEMKERQLDSIRLNNGEVTVNELREEKGSPVFEGDENNQPRGAQQLTPGGDRFNPLFTAPTPQ